MIGEIKNMEQVIIDTVKGWFVFSGVGLYEVLIHSLFITDKRWQLAHPQFGEDSGVPL